MEHFLNEEAVQRSRARVRRYKRLFCALIVLALVFFVVLCLLTRTGNARTMLYLAMAGMVLAGWGLILLWQFAVEPAQAEEKHLSGLAELEPEIREGRFSLTGDAFRIPRSVRIRKVRLETEEETLSLNLNERLADRMPPNGSLVRAEIARKFIIGLEVLEAGALPAVRPKSSRLRKAFRALGRFFLPAVLWAMLAVLFTGFVFNQITDTAPANKIVIYADCEVRNAPQLAEKLEKALDGQIRMVKIHPFAYAMFDSARLKQADLYIVPDSHITEYREWFLPKEGLTLYDPASGQETAGAYFLYVPEGGTSEPFRLYPGRDSVHLEDGLARRAAELLVSITESEKEETP